MTEEARRILFSKYPSIENADKEFFVNKIKNHGYGHISYAVTEKIHGSNTQIDYNCLTGEFEYNKRSGLIAEGEHCYNVQGCFEEVKDKVKLLAEYLKPTLTKKLEVVKVFGEVFGGSYPHPDVPRNPHAARVQKGVFYAPDNHWLAFDIAYMVEDDPTTYFLGFEDFFIACGTCEIKTVPLLLIAKDLDEALQYPNDNPSVVYKEYGLPELENNIMEGVVIRPFKGDFRMGMTRVILKNKNDKFKEVSHTPRQDLTREYSENLNNALAELSTYVTENRVNNVLSHEGEVKEADIGRLLGLAAKDTMEDFCRDSKTYSLLEKPECKILSKSAVRLLAPLVRSAVYERLKDEC